MPFPLILAEPVVLRTGAGRDGLRGPCQGKVRNILMLKNFLNSTGITFTV